MDVMAAIELHRTRERGHLTIPYRVERLEEDADTAETRHTELSSKLDKMNARLLGFLVATAGSAALLAANLLTHKG